MILASGILKTPNIVGFFMYLSQKIASLHKKHQPPPVLTHVLLLLRQHYRNLSARHWIQVVFWQRPPV